MNKLLLIVVAITVTVYATEAVDEYQWGQFRVDLSDESEIAMVTDQSLISFCLKSRDRFMNSLGKVNHPDLYQLSYSILFELVDGNTLDNASKKSHYETMVQELASQDKDSTDKSFDTMMSRMEYKDVFGSLIVTCNKTRAIRRDLLDMMNDTSAVDLEKTGCQTAARIEKINTVCDLAYPFSSRLIEILNQERAQHNLDPWDSK